MRRMVVKLLTFIMAALIWIPCLHLLFRPNAELQAAFDPAGAKMSPVTEALLARQTAMWQQPDAVREEVLRMRESNAEWDFMGRTYLVGSLANIALSHPERKAEYLPLMDRIIDDTLRRERENGPHYFLMAYSAFKPFVQEPMRSQFIDGEIAFMLALRQLVEPLPRYRGLLTDRVDTMVRRMRASPAMCTESYPDECWTFCNAVAMAAIKIADAAQGTDHNEFIAAWLRTARTRLLDPNTGLFISRFRYTSSEHWEGPEGSSIWMIAHCLQILDEDLARDQYARAKRELGRSLVGFDYSREWPRSWEGQVDVDAGMVIPVLGASPGGSGLALLGAASFKDRDFLDGLLTSLNFAGFPVEDEGGLRYAASNQAGDAVMLYAMTLGPAWERVRERSKP